MATGTQKYPVVEEYTPKTDGPQNESKSQSTVTVTPLRTVPPRPRLPSRIGWAEFLLRLASIVCVVGLLAIWIPRRFKDKPFLNPAAYGWLALVFAIDAAEAIAIGVNGVTRVGLRLVLLVDILTLFLYIVAVLVNRSLLEKKKGSAVSVAFLMDGSTHLTAMATASFAFIPVILASHLALVVVNWRRWLARRKAKGAGSVWDGMIDPGAYAIV